MGDEEQVKLSTEVQAAFDTFLRSYQELLATVDSVADPRLRFKQATYINDQLDQLAKSTANWRAATVKRMKAETGLPYAKLGPLIGISDTRAEQLANKATKPERGSQAKPKTPPADR